MDVSASSHGAYIIDCRKHTNSKKKILPPPNPMGNVGGESIKGHAIEAPWRLFSFRRPGQLPRESDAYVEI